jgi:hypothetical protein
MQVGGRRRHFRIAGTPKARPYRPDGETRSGSYANHMGAGSKGSRYLRPQLDGDHGQSAAKSLTGSSPQGASPGKGSQTRWKWVGSSRPCLRYSRALGETWGGQSPGSAGGGRTTWAVNPSGHEPVVLLKGLRRGRALFRR